jgi:hypothetical protein
MLAKIDPMISFDATTFYSDFLFNGTNPVTSEAQSFTHFITPKSNILTGTYTNEARKAPITFLQIEELLTRLRCFWYIDASGMFRIEHVKYFNNGRSYLGQIVGVDLTAQISTHNNKAWAYHTKNYTYRELEMPEFIKCEWMDKTTSIFDGQDIKHLSSFVNKGTTDDKRVSNFTSDILYGAAIGDNVSKDGFYIFNASLSVDVWSVPYVQMVFPGLSSVQVLNGFWANKNLHDKFWKYNLSSQTAEINGVEITVITPKRLKEQTVSIPNVEPDFFRLVETAIGTGEIDKMEVNLTTRLLTITVLHDLDFDAPG